MGNDRCRWVRHRLPLLAGGDLGVEERRRVERHMIGCPGCRNLHRGSEAALSALRSVASLSPVRPDAPSVWPAVARQIRESRHVPPRSSSWLPEWPRLTSGLWPAMGLAMGLGAVMAAALSRDRDLPPSASSTPIEPAAVVDRETPARPARGALPDGSGSLADVGPPAEPPSTRFDYDLDHGTPVGPVGRDVQRSY